MRDSPRLWGILFVCLTKWYFWIHSQNSKSMGSSLSFNILQATPWDAQMDATLFRSTCNMDSVFIAERHKMGSSFNTNHFMLLPWIIYPKKCAISRMILASTRVNRRHAQTDLKFQSTDIKVLRSGLMKDILKKTPTRILQNRVKITTQFPALRQWLLHPLVCGIPLGRRKCQP